MSAYGLSSRAIIGEFYNRLSQNNGLAWVNAIGMPFSSDQPSEEYKWLGMTPVMREWVGGRQAKGFRENGLTVVNKHYEATIEVLVREMRRDKTGQVMVRIRELADRAQTHWASLLSTLILNGPSTACYDGQFFFDTDHSEGASGTQDNDLSIDISALDCTLHGSTTDPSVEEITACMLRACQAIYGFKDDVGEPMNESAGQFTVMVPVTPIWQKAQAAISNPSLVNGASNIIANQQDFKLKLVANPRLTWTTQFAVFRTDGQVKPFILQSEMEVTPLKAKAEGSEFEFDNDAHQYGIDTWRNVAYGYWQHACLVTMT